MELCLGVEALAIVPTLPQAVTLVLVQIPAAFSEVECFLPPHSLPSTARSFHQCSNTTTSLWVPQLLFHKEMNSMGLDGILAITAAPFAQTEPQGTLLRILHNLPCEHLTTFMEEKPPKGNKPLCRHSHRHHTITLGL